MSDETEKSETESCDDANALRKSLQDEKRRAEEYLNRLKYMQADFENLKKRTERQINETEKYANQRLVLQLLEVIDELEIANKVAESVPDARDLMQGIRMTLVKLHKLLENEGVKPIESIGQKFDPARHDAVATVKDDNAQDCTIIEEIRKGYIMKEKVIRPSIVKVTVKPYSES